MHDATIFFTQSQLMQHLADHSLPVPAVRGVTVLYGSQKPSIVDFDISFETVARKTTRYRMVDIAHKIASRPNAIAAGTHRPKPGDHTFYDPDGKESLQFAVGAYIVGISFPNRFKGQWCTGYHDGEEGSFPFSEIALEMDSYDALARVAQTNINAFAKWDFHSNGEEWLSFREGEKITNIRYAYRDDWCWFGRNIKGKSGAFPSAFVEARTDVEARWKRPQSTVTKEPENDAVGAGGTAKHIQPSAENDIKTVCDRDLKNAVSLHDSKKTRELLHKCFPQVAVGEYSWLVELQQLGHSASEIADILIEKSLYGPWIFGEFEPPLVQPFDEDFHLRGCIHKAKEDTEANSAGKFNESILDTTPSVNAGNFEFPIRETVEYFCGLGGARPVTNGVTEIELGSVIFGENDTHATVSFSGLEYSPQNNLKNLLKTWNKILQNLEFAAGVLQQVGGCCDSFTFLSRQEAYIEVQKVELSKLRKFHKLLEELIATYDGTLSSWQQVWSQLSLIGLERLVADYPQPLANSFAIHVCSLTLQFLSLAMLSYSQAHCGPLRPFFLDTAQEKVILLGSGDTNSYPEMPRIVGSLAELTCMGEMTGQPVFAFQYFPKHDVNLIKESSHGKFDLLACPEDLLDTWGPGKLIEDVNDPLKLFAISVRDGIITPIKKAGQTVLHWSRDPALTNTSTASFDRTSKIIIGALVDENPRCQPNTEAQMTIIQRILEELGTFPSYWEVSERQAGLGAQVGQYAVASLQLNQTWVKMRGYTKKSKLLAQRSIYTADLEGPFGVQVSLCTGVARRVRLRELLADILPVYVDTLVVKPPLWRSLNEQFDIINALRGASLAEWLDTLDADHQKTFENLIFAILFLLQDTGVDRKGQNFIVAFIQRDSPSHCFKVPCKKETYWARMLVDSEEVATFAYITTKCLETTQVKCRGPKATWANSIGLLGTAVSCYQDRITSSVTTQWALKDSEVYLLGTPETPLFVRVYRPNRDQAPQLLVSLSNIPREYLYRLYLRGKTRRLSERKAIDQSAESVLVLVSQQGKP